MPRFRKGGVVIITHQNVKAVHLREYEIDGLEVVWADVMLNGLRVVVGSVYFAPGDIKALDIFDAVIGNILSKHSHILIATHANSEVVCGMTHVLEFPVTL